MPKNTKHDFTIRVFQQAQHCSLVDRGANGGLAGSDVIILSESSGNLLALE